MNRRDLLATLPAGALMLHTETPEAQSKAKRLPDTTRLLIGTSKRGSKGIYTAYFHAGELTAPTLAVEAVNPSFLALAKPESPVLFAITQPESIESHASSFTHPAMSDRAGEPFQHIQDAPSKAIGGCHCGVAHTGRAVFISNYTGASVASFHADDAGHLSLASHIGFPATEHGPNPDRQTQSYVHSALNSPDGNFVLVNDLGCDRIRIFRLNGTSAQLTPHDEWHAVPGSGPRHLAIHPNGRWIYCIHELNSTVALLRWNSADGTLATIGTPISTLPADVSADGKRACELVFSRDHRFLYASNRVHESFTVYSIDEATGALTVIQHLPNPGKESRHSAISPNGNFYLSANQFSDEISIFPIDQHTGKLSERTSTVPIPGPSCLLFA